MDGITERDRIIETVNRLFISTDDRDWVKVRALFADRVLFDMTSVAGGQPATMTPQEITDGWDRGLKHLQAIHHQAGNFLVDIHDRAATVCCYGVAWHYLPNRSNRNTRVFVGSYDFHLILENRDWKVDQFKFNLKFIDGNPDLEKA